MPPEPPQTHSPYHLLCRYRTARHLFILSFSILVGATFSATVDLLLIAHANAADIIRVKADTAVSGDGGSWDNAATLQNALQNAESGDEIWVAAGVYKPGNATGDTFELPAGVAVCGGFSGDETERTQRDWKSNLTVLSGDIDGDDIVDADGVVTGADNISGDNSYHVVTVDGTNTPIPAATVLDGFIITAGQANGADPHNYGGGLLCNGEGGNCSPTLANVRFLGNYASLGGALMNDGSNGESSPILRNVVFSGNAAGKQGGAMYSMGANGRSSPRLTNVVFSGNSALEQGGAMYNTGSAGESSPSLINVTFAGNLAGNEGGAMFNIGSAGESSMHLSNVIMWGNNATTGPQIYNVQTDLAITSSLIEGGVTGAGIVNTNCTVTDGGGNLAGGAGDDPLFVQPVSASHAPTTTGNLRLQFGSPAVDAGANGAVTVATDLDGNARMQDGNGDGLAVVDLGAYESPAYHALTVGTDGSGSGDVEVAPAGRTCKAPCVGLYAAGTVVTLSAKANGVSTFDGWSGDAAGTANPVAVTMDTARDVTATFTLKEYALNVSNAGVGSVHTQPNLTAYPHGTVVGLTAIAHTNWLFDAWSGDVTSTSSSATLTMNAAKSVTAHFVLKEYALEVATSGAGSVRRQPNLTAYPHGTLVTLVAAEESNWLFSAWSGDATGSASPITLAMDAAKSVTATFVKTGSISGVVIDHGGNPIEGVTVQLDPCSAAGGNAELSFEDATDEIGAYQFSGLMPDEYTLAFGKAGYATPEPETIEVREGQAATVTDVVMEKTEGSEIRMYVPSAHNAP